MVDALDLREPLCDESGLVLVHAAVRVALDAEDPLAPKDVLAGRARDVHIVYQGYLASYPRNSAQLLRCKAKAQ